MQKCNMVVVGKWIISDMSRCRAVLGLLGVSGFCVRLSGERRSLCENQRDKDKDKEKDGESSESEGVLARAWQVIAEVSSPLGDLPSLESASASVYHGIESGAAGKIGYGFIMVRIRFNGNVMLCFLNSCCTSGVFIRLLPEKSIEDVGVRGGWCIHWSAVTVLSWVCRGQSRKAKEGLGGERWLYMLRGCS